MDAEERKKQKRDWYYANQERQIAASKEYKATHKEELQQKRKEKYETNREEEIRKTREWKAAHPESVIATQRRYRNRNRDEVNRRRRVFNAAHSEERNEWQRAYNAAHREQIRASRIKRLYGLSLEEWNALYEKQNGCCAICKQSFEVIHKLKVDHCHNSTKVRGLLCNPCNTALGLLKDDITVLQTAIEYLTNSKEP